jgi:hypothetical protein
MRPTGVSDERRSCSRLTSAKRLSLDRGDRPRRPLELLSDPAYQDETQPAPALPIKMRRSRRLLRKRALAQGQACLPCGAIDRRRPLGGGPMGPGWHFCAGAWHDIRRVMSVRVSLPSSRRLIASPRVSRVSFGFWPSFTPRPLRASRPSPVRIRPRSSSANPARHGQHQPPVRHCRVGPCVAEGTRTGLLVGVHRVRVPSVAGRARQSVEPRHNQHIAAAGWRLITGLAAPDRPWPRPRTAGAKPSHLGLEHPDGASPWPVRDDPTPARASMA